MGHLNHACKVVRPGRSFLRRMIALLQQYRNKYHPIRLNHGFRSNLHWWASFAAQWNGTSYIATGVQVHFATDASGNWGCGAWHQRSWFQWKWDDVTRLLAIAVKELLPIILATLVCGRSWYGKKVLCNCDNQAVVAGLRSRSSPHPQIMHLLRCLYFVEATHRFELGSTYITSSDNDLADDPSRNNLYRRSIRRCLRPTRNLLVCHRRLSTFCWTRRGIGPLQSGCGSSALFSPRLSLINAQVIRLGPEKILLFLH